MPADLQRQISALAHGVDTIRATSMLRPESGATLGSAIGTSGRDEVFSYEIRQSEESDCQLDRIGVGSVRIP